MTLKITGPLLAGTQAPCHEDPSDAGPPGRYSASQSPARYGQGQQERHRGTYQDPDRPLRQPQLF